tara:strand:- start:526 stop:1860 length:1335 start_codon:yes stop_codon:yes gene_type:complete
MIKKLSKRNSISIKTLRVKNLTKIIKSLMKKKGGTNFSIAEKCFMEQLHKDFKIGQQIGKPSHDGMIIRLCDNNVEECKKDSYNGYIVKYIEHNGLESKKRQILDEIKMQEEIAKEGLTAKIYRYVECTTGILIIMDFIDGETLEDIIEKYSKKPKVLVKILGKVFRKLNILHKMGIFHNDLHHNNIMSMSIKKPNDPFETHIGEMILIDFGRSWKFDSYKQYIDENIHELLKKIISMWDYYCLMYFCNKKIREIWFSKGKKFVNYVQKLKSGIYKPLLNNENIKDIEFQEIKQHLLAGDFFSKKYAFATHVNIIAHLGLSNEHKWGPGTIPVKDLNTHYKNKLQDMYNHAKKGRLSNLQVFDNKFTEWFIKEYDTIFNNNKVEEESTKFEIMSHSNAIGGIKKVRKHRGIHQTGGKVGKLKKGYKYSGRRLKNGKTEIVKVKR